jgi:hypothetical protein
MTVVSGASQLLPVRRYGLSVSNNISEVKVMDQQTQPARLQKLIRKKHWPEYIGKGRTAIEEDVKKGLLKVTKIGQRAVAAYESDLIAYQELLRQQYNEI